MEPWESDEELDWGTEQTDIPPVGSIVLIRLYPNYPSPKPPSFPRYKITKVATNGDLELEYWSTSSAQWQGGHTWNASPSAGVTFRVFRGGAAHWLAPVKPIASNGCNCTKCNIYYPYAEPNQNDGTLVCWSCRNYPYYASRIAS